MKIKKVMCFGTFDKLHKGHISYFKQAKRNGEYLVVVVARDKNVLKIKKRKATEDENLRLENVKKNIEVDDAILGGELSDRYSVIRKFKPDILCLGYDQRVNLEKLKKVFNGEILRMKAYGEDIYKSSLM